MAGNFDILETWLYQRTGTQLTDASFEYTDPQPPARPEPEPPPSTTPNRLHRTPETTKIPTDHNDQRDLVNHS
ncbi:hypothetical protein [Streptomyces bluensis]|uniref:Uncharacterized protein n=1 Tax=Streptomyces bluensis TaxID=33897 RepID=A0ABW6UNK4_9ACTN